MKKFQRTIEDFVCEKCNAKVKGDGYTNHCPECLWSKHVDINPGDRLNQCRGLMKPIDIFFKNQTWHLVHCCEKCKQSRNIKLSDHNFNIEKITNLIKKNLKRSLPS
ncbi:MAG TPA: RNHCP domain-containing protein [Candidatus Moranbacteria bacterium]|nr:RNHCP domain-containing protein [Candidatus Moranbacteria bacterium]